MQILLLRIFLLLIGSRAIAQDIQTVQPMKIQAECDVLRAEGQRLQGLVANDAW